MSSKHQMVPKIAILLKKYLFRIAVIG